MSIVVVNRNCCLFVRGLKCKNGLHFDCASDLTGTSCPWCRGKLFDRPPSSKKFVWNSRNGPKLGIGEKLKEETKDAMMAIREWFELCYGGKSHWKMAMPRFPTEHQKKIDEISKKHQRAREQRQRARELGRKQIYSTRTKKAATISEGRSPSSNKIVTNTFTGSISQAGASSPVPAPSSSSANPPAQTDTTTSQVDPVSSTKPFPDENVGTPRIPTVRKRRPILPTRQSLPSDAFSKFLPSPRTQPSPFCSPRRSVEIEGRQHQWEFRPAARNTEQARRFGAAAKQSPSRLDGKQQSVHIPKLNLDDLSPFRSPGRSTESIYAQRAFAHREHLRTESIGRSRQEREQAELAIDFSSDDEDEKVETSSESGEEYDNYGEHTLVSSWIDHRSYGIPSKCQAPTFSRNVSAKTRSMAESRRQMIRTDEAAHLRFRVRFSNTKNTFVLHAYSSK